MPKYSQMSPTSFTRAIDVSLDVPQARGSDRMGFLLRPVVLLLLLRCDEHPAPLPPAIPPAAARRATPSASSTSNSTFSHHHPLSISTHLFNAHISHSTPPCARLHRFPCCRITLAHRLLLPFTRISLTAPPRRPFLRSRE